MAKEAASWDELVKYRESVRNNYPGKKLPFVKVTEETFNTILKIMQGGANTLRALTELNIHPSCLFDYIKIHPDKEAEYIRVKELAAEIITDDLENLAIDSIGVAPNVFKGINLTIDTRKWCANRILDNKMKRSNPTDNSTPPVNIVINPVGTAEVIPPKPTT